MNKSTTYKNYGWTRKHLLPSVGDPVIVDASDLPHYGGYISGAVVVGFKDVGGEPHYILSFGDEPPFHVVTWRVRHA